MDPIPPDPYAALNVPRDASSAAIKSAYRKLALKFHPDKAKDKGDEFHRIQQAYELIGDDEARSKYDDQAHLFNLRKDVYARRGSYSPNVEVRTAAFDMRSGPAPGTAFQARGPPRYEERRPSGAPMGGPGPRSPFVEEDTSDSYFPSRAGARKYDGYDAGPRRAPSTKAPPMKSAPRAEEMREASRREKVTTSKSRNDKKKLRDQEMGRQRKGKYETVFVSVASDPSDEEDSGAAQRREAPFAADWSRKENRAELYEDLRSEKFQSQSESIRDYINRAKVEGAPMEKVSPPSFQRSTSLQEPPTFAREAPSSPQRDAQYVRRGSRDSRPAVVRKTSSKPKEKSPDSPRSPKSSPKETRSKTTETRASEAAHTTDERRPPPLYTANSAPGNIRMPKSRTMDDYDSKRSPQSRPERSPTSPTVAPALRRASTRKGDSTPVVSSNLRHAETNNDSGYSTSNSPSGTPQPTSTKYYYGPDTVKVEIGVPEYESVLREPSKMYRRSPSPIRDSSPRARERLSSNRERERERPTATRSSSYQMPSQPRNGADADRVPLTSTRRPSMPTRTSSGRSPGLQHSNSSPIPTPPPRAGSYSNNKDGLLFNEFTKDSPIDWRELNFGGSPNVTRVPEDTKVRYTKQFVPDDVAYSSYNHGRRGSEDLARVRAQAFAHMDSTRERGGPAPLKRSGTYAF